MFCSRLDVSVGKVTRKTAIIACLRFIIVREKRDECKNLMGFAMVELRVCYMGGGRFIYFP